MTLEELNRTSPFHAGAENTAFAPYFDGTSYLNMLSTEQVPLDGGGIRSGAKLPGRSVPATW